MKQVGDTRKKRGFIRSVCMFSIYYLVHRILINLPLRLSLSIGRCCGHLLYRCFPSRRKIVLKNIQIMKAWAQSKGLSNSLLELEAADLAKSIFIQNLENFIFALVLMSKPQAVIKQHLRFKNFEVIEKAAQDNKSLLILFAHKGPWELLTLTSQLVPGDLLYRKCVGAIYRPLANPFVDRWIKQIREKNGARLFSREDGFLTMVRFLKARGALFVAVDMRMKQGKPVLLFGKPAASSTIPLKLEKMTGALPLFFVLNKINHTQWEIAFEELPVVDVHTAEGEVAFLRNINEFLEHMIAKNPMDYFFFQDRYKQ
ncbi:MAG: hypothetical protein CML08_00215 [Puniceicoccaceae bacterium]|nr:hypothetical protein [Puniceicoccaceae bacterium]